MTSKSRIAAAIENGNTSRIIKWNSEKCNQAAQDALDNTNGTLKAVRAYLNSKRIAHNL